MRQMHAPNVWSLGMRSGMRQKPASMLFRRSAERRKLPMLRESVAGMSLAMN